MAPPSLLDMIAAASGRAPRLYGKPALIALSHEIENRALSWAREAPVCFGGFQRARFFRTERERWERLAAVSRVCVVAAGGVEERRADGAGGLDIIGVGPEDPFHRDWLCLTFGGPRTAGILIARDLEDHIGLPTADRICEGVWSHDPAVVHAGARWVGAYLRDHRPDLAARWNEAVDGLPAQATPTPRRRRTVVR